MDEKRIEDMLRKSWSPQPPDGMRERILRQSRVELHKSSKTTIWGASRWKFALVSLAVAIVVICNISDHQRSVRIAKMTGSSYSDGMPLPAGKTYFEMKREMKELLASVPYDSCPDNSAKGDESL